MHESYIVGFWIDASWIMKKDNPQPLTKLGISPAEKWIHDGLSKLIPGKQIPEVLVIY